MSKKILFAMVLVLALGSALLFSKNDNSPAKMPSTKGYATATFAGGCFWCMESSFEKIPGVLNTTVGFMGGTLKKPLRSTARTMSPGASGTADRTVVTPSTSGA